MTAAELSRYRGEIEASAEASRRYVLRRLAEEGAGLDVAGRRELAIEVIQDATGVYGDRAQATAAELFDEVMEADGVDARARMFDGLIDYGRTEGSMHYAARKLVDGDVAGFDGDASDLAAYYVHRSAWFNLVNNCDLNHVMWARVPTGEETCGWCYMLASRGFAYHTQAAASHKHTGCDCVVVPGNKGSVVAGVDTSWLRECWNDCYETVGGPLSKSETRALWDALPDEKREEWRRKHGPKAFERFHERESVRHICEEVERRDAGWLYGQKDRRYPLYSRYNVVETIDTGRGRVEVIRYNQSNNNKRPGLAGRPNAIYAMRSKAGQAKLIFFTNEDGIIIEEWNCMSHGHYVDGELSRWHKHVGSDHLTAETFNMDADDMSFWKEVNG